MSVLPVSRCEKRNGCRKLPNWNVEIWNIIYQWNFPSNSRGCKSGHAEVANRDSRGCKSGHGSLPNHRLNEHCCAFAITVVINNDVRITGDEGNVFENPCPTIRTCWKHFWNKGKKSVTQNHIRKLQQLSNKVRAVVALGECEQCNRTGPASLGGPHLTNYALYN